MLGSIALPSALGLFLAVSLLLVFLRKRPGRASGHYLNDLSPVSGQWLADRRRSG
jgi:hypothetical protein